MENISADLVERYIEAAEAASRSPIEKMVTREARRVSSNLSFGGLEIAAAAESRRSKKKNAIEFRQVTIESWKHVILKQLHIALCQRSSKYSKEVATLREKGELLIGAITGYVAAKVGAAAVVIAALVAALLQFAMSMGISAFCEWSGRLVRS